MAIKERLSERELALADVLEDPVWLPELMRSTHDLSPYKENWPKKPFAYRWYQRDLLTDRSPKIVLRGGRAIGKCQPETARILTDKGYRTIREIRTDIIKFKHVQRINSFIAYALTEDGKLVQSRAVLQKDKETAVYELKTTSGKTVRATKDHPFLTPKGYATLELLQAGDSVAVMTALPDPFTNSACRWHELRYLGYISLAFSWQPEKPITYKNKAIRNELLHIAQLADHYGLEGEGIVSIKRKKAGLPHFLRQFMIDINEENLQQTVNANMVHERATVRRIPRAVMRERRENVQVFLEAMFAQYAEITRRKISVYGYTHKFCQNVQELLLRFGIESNITDATLTIEHPTSVYRFFTQFTIPGISVENIQAPPQTFDPSEFYRFEEIESITLSTERVPTYSIFVYDHHTYITDHFITHNSLVMEDKIIYETLNHKTVFPDTKEFLLATANQAQMEPLLGRLISRFTSSHLLKDFLQNRINRSLGVMEFRFGDIQHLIRSRIAGKDDANLVGLHVARMAIDESQLFQIRSWVQLAPALNQWQQNTQLFFAGVPSGLRTSLLYYADKKLSGFKTYAVPAHNNPFYTLEDDLDNIKRYGGRETDDYVQLVCGGHGKAAYSVITRDQIEQLSYDFHRIVYTNEHMKSGMHYTSLDTPNLSEYDTLAVGMDCGYVDPSIISILGFKGGRWYVAVRYVLKRIDFETQKQFLHYLMKHYRFSRIGIDAASGGGGMQIIHALLNHPDFVAVDYRDVVVPVMFSERIPVGYDTEGKEMTVTTKTFGANLLVQQLQQKEIVLSEIDYELVSELERMTKQRGVSGMDTYYILSEKGNGAATEDHNFASMICFCVATRDMSFQKKRRKKLGKSGGKY